ncbi:MAG: thioredoxin domain-containing protein, partial [Anaerolineales bacterium]
LQRVFDDASLGARFKLSQNEVVRRLAYCNTKLLHARSQRTRPGTDDKVLTAWNGLMLQTFAEAARIVQDKDVASVFRKVAMRSADFLLSALYPAKQVQRSWRAGKAGNDGFLEDYAALSGGLVELYQADFDQRWFLAAKELADAMIAKFSDPSGGFFDTAADAETLPVRPKDIQDNATPSGSALACDVLLKLAALTGNAEYRDQAERALAQISDAAMRFPSAFGRWLSAADHSLSAGKQIAVVYEGGAENAAALLAVVNAEYRPNVVLVASAYPPPKEAPTLLADRPLKDGKATAYVCENFVCKLPVNSVEELQRQLQI